ncbi:MAG: 30S ribosomal protein S12 [Nanoarchaeota archaeon]|nr:30S ribosomal protein S12 [Nanoarchaeota archaeon]
MAKKPRGLNAGKKLRQRRKKFRFAKKDLAKMKTKAYKKTDPLEGAPAARGIVIQKMEIEVKQPHSGLRKCVKVQIAKNGRTVGAYAGYGPGAIKFIDEHNEVIIERMGAPQRRAFGDMPGIKFRVIKVNGVSIKELVKGRKEKPMR